MSDKKTITLLGLINGQKLRISQPVVVSDTISFIEMKFQFSEEWDGLIKVAHFRHDGEEDIVDFILEDDRITKDKQLNFAEGQYELWIHGYEIVDGNKVERGTTTKDYIVVETTGELNGEDPMPVPPSIGEQILATAYAAKDTAEEALEKVSDVISVADEAKEISDEALLVAQEAKEIAEDAYSVAGEADNAANEAIYIAQTASDKVNEAILGAEQANETADAAVLIAQSTESKAANAETAARNAVIVAQESVDNANTALNKSQGALTEAQNAKNIANTAYSKADDAIDIANGAVSLAVEAKEEAQNAEETSQDAIDTANLAKTTANNAVDTANTANTKAIQAYSKAESAATAARRANESADSAVSIANSVRQDADDGKFDGKQGDPGEPGYTPVKGVDYYTAEEKNEIIDTLSETVLDNALYTNPDETPEDVVVPTWTEHQELAEKVNDVDDDVQEIKEDLSALAAKVVEYKTVTINVKDTEGNPVVGNGTVVVSDGNGNVFATINYSGNPVVQRLPIGFGYSITVNDDIEEYYSPDVITGVVTANATITVTLHKIGVISSFADIQYLVQHGIADRVFSIGDQIHVNYTYNGTVYDCPFDVVAFENVTLKDGSVVPGMYLQQHFATIESIPINNAEQTVATEATAQAGWYYYGFTSSSVAPVLLNLKTGDTIDYSAYPSIYKSSIRDTTGNIARYGYNNYAKSIYREWLNSDKAAGQWHTAQYQSQPTPSQVNQYRGYIAGLDPEFVAIVGETEQKVALSTITDGGEIVDIYDKFFLPSLEQMYGVPQLAGAEGAYWEYWKQHLGYDAPSNKADNNRKIMALNAQTSAQSCRLRSANRGLSSSVWFVSASTGRVVLQLRVLRESVRSGLRHLLICHRRRPCDGTEPR